LLDFKFGVRLKHWQNSRREKLRQSCY
jgi:hypothetical protein